MAPMESFELGSPPPRALRGHSSHSRSRSQAAIQSTPPSSVTRRQTSMIYLIVLAATEPATHGSRRPCVLRMAEQSLGRLGPAVQPRSLSKGESKAPVSLRLAIQADGAFYIFFGGIWGGQLQRWNNEGDSYNASTQCTTDKERPDAPAILPRFALLSDDLLSLAHPPREVITVMRYTRPQGTHRTAL